MLDLFGSGLIDPAAHVARVEACVAQLALACGYDPRAEVERFKKLRARLDSEQAATTDMLAMMRKELGAVLAMAWDPVLVYRDGAPRGFALLTQGPYGAALPDRTARVFAAAVASYVEEGGDVRGAESLADVFRACFPDLHALAAYDAAAQALVVAFVPRKRGIDLKIYFNTRLSPGPNKDRVRAALGAAGLQPADYAALYDALYAGDARFAGVGFDVDASPVRRMKLYVRLPVDAAVAHASTLAPFALHSARSFTEATLGELPRHLLTSDLELAVSLRSDGARSLKLTAFFDPAADTEPVLSACAALLARHRADAAPLRAAAAALAIGTPASGRRQPIHGLGFESGAPDKINVYFQPPV